MKSQRGVILKFIIFKPSAFRDQLSAKKYGHIEVEPQYIHLIRSNSLTAQTVGTVQAAETVTLFHPLIPV